MSKDLDTGSVREARMEAKKLARKGAHTHQQALDQIARERGHRNWSAFLSSEGQGGVRGGSPEPRKPRVATSRDLQDETETRYLEDAADLKQDWPSWPLQLTTTFGGAMWLMILLTSVSHPMGLAWALGIYFVLTLGAGAIAGRSPDGFLKARRRISSVGTVAGLSLVGVAGFLYAYGLLYYGHHHVLGSAFAHPLFDRGSLAYVVGITTLVTSHRIHRTMAVAVPDSVRPASREDLVVAESEEQQPGAERFPRLMAALVLVMFLATGVAALGAAVMVVMAIAFLFTHELATTVLSFAVGGVFGGVVLAMAPMMVLLVLDRRGGTPMQAARHRASRARRFLKAARKAQAA